MTQLGIDLSIARPSGRAIAAAGYSFVIGYLSNGLTLGGRPKDLDALYIADLQAAGLGVAAVWETSATAALGGGAAGQLDGAKAVAEAHRIGIPAGCLVMANLGDFAATPAQIGSIHEYYYEFRRVAGFDFQPGGYATGYIIDQLAAAGAAGCWWQNAMNDAGESGSVVSHRAAIYQRTAHTRPAIAGIGAGDYDEDVADLPGAPYVPAWYFPGRTVTPTPAPAPAPAPAPSPAPAPLPEVTRVTVTVAMSDGSSSTKDVYP